MRNIRHHTLIVTVNDKKATEQICQSISDIFKRNMEAKNGFQLISPIVSSLINNYYTFFISPDGSKEGYDLSDDADRIRPLIIDLLKVYQTENSSIEINFVELFYGDDSLPAQIINHN